MELRRSTKIGSDCSLLKAGTTTDNVCGKVTFTLKVRGMTLCAPSELISGTLLACPGLTVVLDYT